MYLFVYVHDLLLLKAALEVLPWFSSVNLDNKPPKFASRMLGECKRIYLPGPQNLLEPLKGVLEFEPPVEKDLSRFEFFYFTEGMPEDSALRKDLEKWNRDLKLKDSKLKGGISSGGSSTNSSASSDSTDGDVAKNPRYVKGVVFEMNICNDFPMKPPQIRIVHPQLQGGYTWGSGAICFEALTVSGWISSMSLPSLANALVAFLNDKENPVRLVSVGEDGKTIKGYTREAALKEGRSISEAHQGGWGKFKPRS